MITLRKTTDKEADSYHLGEFCLQCGLLLLHCGRVLVLGFEGLGEVLRLFLDGLESGRMVKLTLQPLDTILKVKVLTVRLGQLEVKIRQSSSHTDH